MKLRCTSLRLPLPPGEVDLLRAFDSPAIDSSAERFFWTQPDAGLQVLGLGEAAAVETTGRERFDEAAAAVRDVLDGLEIVGEEPPAGMGARVVGGFSFRDRASFAAPWEAYPSCRFVLPRLLLVRGPEGCWLTGVGREPGDRIVNAVKGRLSSATRAHDARCGFESRGIEGFADGPEYRVRSDRSHADYRAQVEAARSAIREGAFEKVVLARSLHVRHPGRFDVPGLLGRLRDLYPACATFAVARAGSCFLGATPERLVALEGDRVRTSALAGSAPRGRSPEEDESRGRALRESKKEQAEHAVVVRSIAEALRPVCADVAIPEAPRLLRLEGIQHLETPIEGRLAAPGSLSLLELAGRLHPTPAVGGAPAEPALDWIGRCEGLDRGWYAGGVGFVDRRGGGEIHVALRSGVVRSSDEQGVEEATLFAGGGIVADSEAESELEETRIKLRALLAPLTEI